MLVPCKQPVTGRFSMLRQKACESVDTATCLRAHEKNQVDGGRIKNVWHDYFAINYYNP